MHCTRQSGTLSQVFLGQTQRNQVAAGVLGGVIASCIAMLQPRRDVLSQTEPEGVGDICCHALRKASALDAARAVTIIKKTSLAQRQLYWH